jgi:hypothetical protein
METSSGTEIYVNDVQLMNPGYENETDSMASGESPSPTTEMTALSSSRRSTSLPIATRLSAVEVKLPRDSSTAFWIAQIETVARRATNAKQSRGDVLRWEYGSNVKKWTVAFPKH